MIDYSIIDVCLTRWASAKGYHIQTMYRDEPVRSIELWSADHTRKAQIGITDLTSERVEVTAFDGHKHRVRFKGEVGALAKLLDDAEKQVREWISLG